MSRANLILITVLALASLAGDATTREVSSAYERWGVTQDSTDDEVIERLLARAYKLLYDNEFEDAQSYYELVLEMEPNSAEAYIGMSFTHRYLGDVDEAFQSSEKALELDPYASSAHWIYGELLWPWRGVQLGMNLSDEDRVALSIDHLEKASRSDHPTAAHAHVSLWTAYMVSCQRNKMREQLLEMKAEDYFPQSVLDFAFNVLISVDENAIVITGGDMDTYPLHYLQQAYGFRPDVRVVNASLVRLPQVIECMRDSLNLPISDDDHLNGQDAIKNIIANAQQRYIPVYFAITIDEDISKGYESLLVLEGLVYRLGGVATKDNWDVERIARNMTSNYKIDIPDRLEEWSSNISPITRKMNSRVFRNYLALYGRLLRAYMDDDDISQASFCLERMFEIYRFLGDDSGVISILRYWMAIEPDSPRPKELVEAYLDWHKVNAR